MSTFDDKRGKPRGGTPGGSGEGGRGGRKPNSGSGDKRAGGQRPDRDDRGRGGFRSKPDQGGKRGGPGTGKGPTSGKGPASGKNTASGKGSTAGKNAASGKGYGERGPKKDRTEDRGRKPRDFDSRGGKNGPGNDARRDGRNERPDHRRSERERGDRQWSDRKGPDRKGTDRKGPGGGGRPGGAGKFDDAGKSGPKNKPGHSGKPGASNKPAGKPGHGSKPPKSGRPRDDRRERGPQQESSGEPARPRTPEPELPEGAESSKLHGEIRREMGSLPKGLADNVAAHLVAAGELMESEPERALEHARFARHRASRVGAVREANGLTAYHNGEWSEALAELRAARRMTGDGGHLAIMADCERALGRPERALELQRGPEAAELAQWEAVELRIVAAGARRDLGEIEASVVSLQIPELDPEQPGPWSARLFYAYADNLLAAGRVQDAFTWFVHSAHADDEEETDAPERLEQLVDELGGPDAAEELITETVGEAPEVDVISEDGRPDAR